MAEGYAIGQASRLKDIGFAEFTSDLITQTFDALIDAELRQTESYIELVKEMTKSLSAYINETKNEIPPAEVAGYLASLPPITKAGAPVTTTTGQPLALESGEKVKNTDLNAINQALTSGDLVGSITEIANSTGITGLIKDALGLVSAKMTGGSATDVASVFPAQDKTYYSPAAFEVALGAAPGESTISAAAVAKLYDSVAEVIAGNKYALLQEMVKLGVTRLVVERGVIRTGLTFTTWEQQTERSSSSEKHKTKMRDVYVQKSPRSMGILGLIRGRPMERTRNKTRQLHVSTAEASSSSSQGTTITITGGVEIYFRTDYLPVAQA